VKAGHLLPSFKKKLHVWQPLAKKTIDHKEHCPFLLFLRSDVSAKAWPRQLPLNKSLSRRVTRLCFLVW